MLSSGRKVIVCQICLAAAIPLMKFSRVHTASQQNTTQHNNTNLINLIAACASSFSRCHVRTLKAQPAKALTNFKWMETSSAPLHDTLL